MSYGAFGQVAAHELTVRSIHWIFTHPSYFLSFFLFFGSTLLILLGGCTTKKGNWSNGGQMPPAKASERNKIVSSSNSPVLALLFTLTFIQCLYLAYSIDDGKGGRIYVNVSRSFCSALSNIFNQISGQSVRVISSSGLRIGS